MPAGKKSLKNSTTTALAADATYTGTWERLDDYVALSINAEADVAGTLWADFSADGSTALRQVQLSSGANGSFGIHALVKVSRFFRVRVVNGSTIQGSLTVETLLHKTPLMAQPTSRAAQVVHDHYDVVNTRVLSDVFLDEAAGRHSTRSVIHKFGRNPSVGTSEEDIWFAGGAYNWLQAADNIRVASGGNSNDTAAGSGARTITVAGLDENWEEVEEDITLAGASASSATTNQFIRVPRAWVKTCGTYTGANAGAITIETDAGSPITVARIETGVGQTQLALYTIPEGKVGFIRSRLFTVESNKSATLLLWQRQNADTVSGSMTAKRIVEYEGGLTETNFVHFDAYLGPFPSKTDLWFSSLTSSGTSAVSAAMDIVLISEVS